MQPSFVKCPTCGKIVPAADGLPDCQSCNGSLSSVRTRKDMLRDTRSALKDATVNGAMMTMPQLSELVDVPEAIIWEFVKEGQIELARINDPAVRQYLVQRRREQARSLRKVQTGAKEPAKAGKESKGFHLRDVDRER